MKLKMLLPPNVQSMLYENSDALNAIAKGVDYITFLKKTDSLASRYDMLYRGGGELRDKAFMTDYIGHAISYSDGEDDIDGILYNTSDVLRINDRTFESLRTALGDITKSELRKIYSEYFRQGMLGDAMSMSKINTDSGVINFVHKFIKSNIPYDDDISKDKVKNDFLVPIMLHYAESKRKNIIVFWGGDYGEYGGADEFVVNDISKYPTLRSVWRKNN